MRNNRIARHLCLSACVIFFASSVGRAQSHPLLLPYETSTHADITVTSSLVVLPVKVTDSRGNNIDGLKKEDFSVYDDKQIQQLSLFQKENTPVSVGLIVDHSASMQSKLPNIISAISAFAQSGVLQDEMFVVNFNDNVTIEPSENKKFTTDPAELRKALAAVTPAGRTALYDAIDKGLERLELSRNQKKALIIISDGGDNASYVTRPQVLALAQKSQVTIYSIVLVDDSTQEQNPKTLLTLCKETGGSAFFPQTEQAVLDVSSVIARDLRELYVLGFTPDKHSTSDSFRKIQVRVVAPAIGKLQVRTRTGYFQASEPRRSGE